MPHPAAMRLIVAVMTVSIASPAAAQGPPQPTAPAQALATDSNAFYARVATFFGMEPRVLQQLEPDLRGDGLSTRDAVLLIIFAHKRTLRLLRDEQITKSELEQRFRDIAGDLLRLRRARTDWKTFVCDQLGVDLHAMIKQAGISVREATRAMDTAHPARPTAAPPAELPDDLHRPVLERVRVGPETLRAAWGALDPIAQRSPRAAVILLVLAKEKGDRVLEYRPTPATDSERDQLFLEALADFMTQVESRPRVGWGTLASHVGLVSTDLQREAASIFAAAAERQRQRTESSGGPDASVVPSELAKW